MITNEKPSLLALQISVSPEGLMELQRHRNDPLRSSPRLLALNID